MEKNWHKCHLLGFLSKVLSVYTQFNITSASLCLSFHFNCKGFGNPKVFTVVVGIIQWLLSLVFLYKGLKSMFYMFILVLCLLRCLWHELFPMGTVELLKIQNHLWQESWCTCGILHRLAEILASWPLFHRSRKVSCLTKLK